uniref:Reverse transcriptase domain-containing protein n=1 Tax=Chromera velia CCMP2878 TaxID=1169474 RepID=A0A0G4FXJ7_9ALVE|eukprot:Cvel_3877.t1-p1 / transcript=Cvel_3877.t1 / gene=Cvel_3877 / organism=Chromera_velia_CCMP2878 / gene_product=Retrovirus-related Pol polyprotein from transposon, putative / transcript_product=Retrovirus-related Pol polyprotein from transposon, putative / location=Cvel_scaffold164:31475-32779(+) / protein_length=435 / sequence_SO=supercontig / SO=protein_coding / is_pseudo=false
MCTRYSNYEWLVMPFGMCNPPLTSQRAIQVCLREVLDDCAFTWIDDILVYSPTVDQHKEDLQRVLGYLKKDEYYVKISKCKLFIPKVVYIGLEISDVGVRAELKKTELIQTWSKPENKHELHIFLGLCNWFWRFIYKYSHITAPLTSLLQAKVKFVWSEVCEAAFKELKEKIAELILLFIPDPTRPFDLYVDTSEKEICITAALMQWDPRVNGLRVVALTSRKLVQAEQKYPIREKELLAVMFGVKTFRIYVNHTTKVYSDHESLKWLGTSGGLIEGPNRVKRWAIFLNALGIVPQYIPGSKNVVADALSRRPSRTRTQKQTGEERSDEKETDRIAQVESTQKVCPDAKFLDQVRKGYAQDSFFKEFLPFLIHTPTQGTPFAYLCLRLSHFSVKEGLLYYDQRRLAIPTKTLQRQVIWECHDSPLAGHLRVDKTY